MKAEQMSEYAEYELIKRLAKETTLNQLGNYIFYHLILTTPLIEGDHTIRFDCAEDPAGALKWTHSFVAKPTGHLAEIKFNRKTQNVGRDITRPILAGLIYDLARAGGLTNHWTPTV